MRSAVVSYSCLLGLAAFIASGGCDRSGKPAPELKPLRVTVAYPESRELTDYDEYAGFLDAAERVEVRSRVRGHIQKVHFKDGQLVKSGALLFELDPRTFQTEIDRAKETLKIGIAQHQAAFKEEDRLKELLTKGGASKSQVEKAEADARSLEAQIAAYQEEIKRRELDLEFSRVTAPIDGRIDRAMLTAGNLVNAGGSDPLLTTIVTIDPIQVYFRVDERSFQKYQALAKHKASEAAADKPAERSGQFEYPFHFGLDSDEGYPHAGTLTFAANRLDRATGTIEVRGDVANADGGFVPGSRARIRLPIGQPYQAITVPDRAILSDQDRKYVLLVNDKDVVARRDVTLGRLLDDGQRVILKNLTADELLVVDGLQRARVDYPIEPMNADAEDFVRRSE